MLSVNQCPPMTHNVCAVCLARKIKKAISNKNLENCLFTVVNDSTSKYIVKNMCSPPMFYIFKHLNVVIVFIIKIITILLSAVGIADWDCFVPDHF